MRSFIGSLLLAAATIGVFGFTSSQAQAQWGRRIVHPVSATTYYNYVPNFNAYPWNYYAAIGAYGTSPSYYPPVYGYYPPFYNYGYTLPSYQYYYGPGYAQYYYTPGSSYYWLR